MATTVKVESVGCCAMLHAFLRNPGMMRQWGATVGRLDLLCTIFQNTIRMMFTPDVQTVEVYRAFASAEVKRLQFCIVEETDTRLVCRHTANQHIAALRDVLKQFPRGN
jgi:hypothetical protein